MSIIAIKKIDVKCTLPRLVKALSKAINGHFEALNFIMNKQGLKMCYLRLSEKLDPLQVVERINFMTIFSAFIPEHVPDLPLARHGKGSTKMQRKPRMPEELPPDQVLIATHNEILIEMQSKYTGLYNLSKKTGHELLGRIARTVADRLKQIIEVSPDASETGFKLSKMYRKLHPHFGDFQLVLSTLHRIQDEAGVPRSQIAERQLAAHSTATPCVMDNIPFNLVQSACTKYSDRIVKKVTEHINSLKSDITETDSEEDLARKKVREELKKLPPYLSLIINQVISNTFVPQKAAFHIMKIYGEPFIPPKKQMAPFLKRYRVGKVMRSDRMFNVLRVHVPLQQYSSLAAMDGTVIGGAKLVIRSADIPHYKVPVELKAEMKAAFGIEQEGTDDWEELGEVAEGWDDEVLA